MATYQLTKLMNKYYEKVGKAAANLGSCPKLIQFKAGFGLVDETTTPPTLQPIPADLTAIPGIFYTGTVDAAWNTNKTTCKCTIPAGSVTTATKFNVLGLYDQDGDLMAVCTTMPDWVTPTEEDTSYAMLTFPIVTP